MQILSESNSRETEREAAFRRWKWARGQERGQETEDAGRTPEHVRKGAIALHVERASRKHNRRLIEVVMICKHACMFNWYCKNMNLYAVQNRAPIAARIPHALQFANQIIKYFNIIYR